MKRNLFQQIRHLCATLSSRFRARREKALRRIEYERLKRVRKHTVPQYKYCKNCGAELHGMYCSNCGQYALDINQNVFKLIREYCENTYQLDGKIVQTLKYLVIRPGFLSREFLDGKIKSYVHPMKLYLFLSMVFFSFVLLFALNHKPGSIVSSFSKDNVSLILENDSVPQEQLTLNAFRDSISALQDSSQLSEEELELVKPFMNLNYSEREKKIFFNEISAMMIKYIPIMIMFLMPLYGWILRMVFHRSKPRYLDSLIFSVHIHSALIILMSLAVFITSFWASQWVENALFLLFAVYLLLAMKNFYERGWVVTIYKSCVSLMIYSLLIGMCFSILVVIVALHIAEFYNFHL